MQKATLTAESRDQYGKGVARRLRVAGKIPAVIYGKKAAPRGLALDTKSITKVLGGSAGLNVLIDLTIQGEQPVVALVKDYQVNPLKRVLTHVDFLAVDMNAKMDVEVPVHFEGTSPGIKEGGILEVSRRTLHIRCLPSNIPDAIVVDISTMAIGDSVHATDVKLPAGVEFPFSENFSVVQIVAPQKEDAAATTAAAAPAAAPAAAAAKPAAKK